MFDLRQSGHVTEILSSSCTMDAVQTTATVGSAIRLLRRYWPDIDHRDAGAPVAGRQALEQCSSADTKSTSVVTAVKACRQVVGDVACLACDDPNADG